MPPYTNLPLSPAELAYLHTSLAANPPIRPDARKSTQFRPLIAERNVLPTANGSARVCFADGTEAVVGVKAEVEKTRTAYSQHDGEAVGTLKEVEQEEEGSKGKGRSEWLDLTIDVPGLRDDDALPTFLSALLAEPLLADTGLLDRLYINDRYHWRLYIDILLLSQPLSYPLPLLSLTTHLALLSTRLPALLSEQNEDPLFNDDWEASTYLYPPTTTQNQPTQTPPVTLLVVSVADTILFDPSKEELAVADAVIAVSVTTTSDTTTNIDTTTINNRTTNSATTPLALKLLALRTIDPPSRLTPHTPGSSADTDAASVWMPPRGGMPRSLVGKVVKACLEPGGVGEEVLRGLEGVEW